MSDAHAPPATAPKWLAWMPAAAMALTIGGIVSAGGGYLSTQAEHGRKIEALERRESDDREKRIEQITDIRERTIRIEARLDALVPEDRKATR